MREVLLIEQCRCNRHIICGWIGLRMTSLVGVSNHEEINLWSLFCWRSLLGILVLLSIMKTMFSCNS
ncbi:hypothetical protein CMV_021452 [Castanea mollissima]|uniref:Uncharacterized protein n=1 Tax=Castanea mollissima TaxID=60419 RepID=A0A8J4VLM9_9ROSI|nr:hypothetical protein CMV_021452 [Castanea mollissima]